MKSFLTLVLAAFMAPILASAQTSEPGPLTAIQSDPSVMGWRAGTPPPPERWVRFEDQSFLVFPQTRWSFSNWREVFPTSEIWRGQGPVGVLPQNLRNDLDSVTFTPIGGGNEVTWEQSLPLNYTDGIMVIHKGQVVYERYFGALTAPGQHIAHSVTKSLVGTVAAMLIQEGRLDRSAAISTYIPELAQSGFGDATVGQVLDMTTSLDYSEVYTDPDSDAFAFVRAAGLLPQPPDYRGPTHTYDYLKTLKKPAEHGREFRYRSVNTEVVGWLVARISGKPLAQVLSERFWQPMGMERDAYLHVDSIGTGYAAGGLSLTLRDLGRFCEMMRNRGRFNGLQIVPAEIISDISNGGSREAFVYGGYPTLPGWSYRNQWWVSHNPDGAYMARGVFGQACYVNPRAETTIVRFASGPNAGNTLIDPLSLPAYQAMADHLRRAAPGR